MATPAFHTVDSPWKVERFLENPIITPYMMDNPSENINGPCLIKVPDWVTNRLGRYYLYFANHEGEYIRMAYANNLHGPWKIYGNPILPLKILPWKPDHVASPHVVIHEETQEIWMYFHTPVEPMLHSSDPDYYKNVLSIKQKTFLAISRNGLDFSLDSKKEIADFYFHAWKWRDAWYAFDRGALTLYRSENGKTFESAPSPFAADMEEFKFIRHICVLQQDNLLTVFYTRVHDAPERIFMVQILMNEHWKEWKIGCAPKLVLKPEAGYEGANLPVIPTDVGATVAKFENGVRDPFVYCEDGRIYLLYSVVGERGIAAAELRS